VKGQVRAGLAFLKERYGAKEFILYFQAFSNTNAPVDELRSVYDAGLSLAPFRGLNVATRPDCVDEAKARLLASYQKRGLEVWVEMGLQTAHDSTLSNVRRGHTTEDFLRAYRIVKDADLKVAAHLIFGLPGEGRQEILETVDFVARLGVHGVKIHNLHIPRGTLIEREWLMGELTAPSPERHLEWVIAAIERLPATTVIMRLTCDTPDSRLSSPRHFWKKETFLSRVAREMRERGANQGNLFGSRT
jgi:radical SAM protein (TIGR01212 family)